MEVPVQLGQRGARRRRARPHRAARARRWRWNGRRARFARSKRSSASTATQDKQPPPDDQIASVRQAMANRDDARAAFERAQQLSGRGLLAQVDRDTAETRLKVTEANYQAAVDNVRSLKASLQDRRASYELAQKKVERRRRSRAGGGLGVRAPRAARGIHPREHAGRHDRADESPQVEDGHSGEERRRHQRRSIGRLRRRGVPEQDVPRQGGLRQSGRRPGHADVSGRGPRRQRRPRAQAGILCEGHGADAPRRRACWRRPTTRCRRWPACRRCTSSRTARRASRW